MIIISNKNKFCVLNGVLLTFFIFTIFSQIAISAEKAGDEKEKKQEIKEQVKEKKNPYANAQITTRIIPSVNKTFGYEILLYGRPLVRQLNIPALPGNEGFSTKEQAQKVAGFVAKKVKSNEMPPTVTIDDLRRMGALKKK